MTLNVFLINIPSIFSILLESICLKDITKIIKEVNKKCNKTKAEEKEKEKIKDEEKIKTFPINPVLVKLTLLALALNLIALFYFIFHIP